MIPRKLVSDTVLDILHKAPEPASIRDLADAVYYRTGDDRVGYTSVASALHQLSKHRLVTGRDGLWSAVTA